MPSRVQLTHASLKRVGVFVMNVDVRLACDACCQMWSPDLLPGGPYPRGWWKCPAGCNGGGALDWYEETAASNAGDAA